MRRGFLLLLLVSLFLSLTSCGKEARSAGEQLAALLERTAPLPAGATYDSDRAEWEQGRFDEQLATALFARADGSLKYAECVESAAVYLSSVASPYLEVGVFVCYGNADVRAVSEMCLRRADMVTSRLHLSEDAAHIVIDGRTVFLFIASDEEARARLIRAYT